MATYPSRLSLTQRPELSLLACVLAVAATTELAILRTFTRTAVHIPALPALREPYTVLTHAGEYAYYVAVGLLVPVLLLVAVRQAKRDPATILATALFASVAVLATLETTARPALDAATVGAVVLLCAGTALARGLRAGFPVAMFGVAFGLSGWFSVAPNLLGRAAETQPAWLLEAVEATGVAFALSSPLLLRAKLDRVSVAVGVLIGAFALLLFLGNGSTSRFLLLWNVGLSGTLPGVVYAAAAGALFLTVAALFRERRTLEAVGLLILIGGGIGLHSTYQSGLVVAGLGLMAVGLAEQPGVTTVRSWLPRRMATMRKPQARRAAA